jgi:hypothetical protein
VPTSPLARVAQPGGRVEWAAARHRACTRAATATSLGVCSAGRPDPRGRAWALLRRCFSCSDASGGAGCPLCGSGPAALRPTITLSKHGCLPSPTGTPGARHMTWESAIETLRHSFVVWIQRWADLPSRRNDVVYAHPMVRRFSHISSLGKADGNVGISH